MEGIGDRERVRNMIARKDLTCEMKPTVEALSEYPRLPVIQQINYVRHSGLLKCKANGGR